MNFKRIMKTFVAKKLFLGRTLIAFALLLSGLSAMPSYEDVLLVVRQGDAESAEVADYFKNARQMPAANVVSPSASVVKPAYGQAYMTKVSRDTFVNDISNYLVTSGLQNKINYIVLSSGFPKIAHDNAGGTQTCLLDVYLMLKLSGKSDFISKNPYAFVKTNNFYNRSGIGFSKLKYGYFIVSRLEGPGSAVIKKMIDNTGTISHDQYKTGVKFVFQEDSTFDLNNINTYFVPELSARGVASSFYNRTTGGAIHNIQDISFLHLDWVIGPDQAISCREECQTYLNVFKRLTFKPGAVASCFRSFPMEVFRKEFGGLGKYEGGVVTPYLKVDGSDLDLRQQNSVALNSNGNTLWCAVGCNPYFLTPNPASDKSVDDAEYFRGNGVVVYDKNGVKIAHYTAENTGGGLLCNNVTIVKYDPWNKRIWVGTYKGLCYYDLLSHTWGTAGAPNIAYSSTRAQVYDIYVDPTTLGKFIYVTFAPGVGGFALNPSLAKWSSIVEINVASGAAAYYDLGMSARQNIRLTKTASNIIWAAAWDSGTNVNKGPKIVKYDTDTLTQTYALDLTNVGGTNYSSGLTFLLYNIDSIRVNGTNFIYAPISSLLSASKVWNGVLKIAEISPVSNAIKIFGSTNFKCDGSTAYTDRAFKVFVNPRSPDKVGLLVRRYYYISDVAKILWYDDANPEGVEYKNGSLPINYAVNDAVFDEDVDDKIWFVRSHNTSGQEILPDFFANGLVSGIGGTSHDNYYYDGVSSFSSPADQETISSASTDYKLYSASTTSTTALPPFAFRYLDGYNMAESRFGTLLRYPIHGSGGYDGHMFVMDPKCTPYGPRVDFAALDPQISKSNTTYRTRVKVFSPMLKPADDFFLESTINASTVRLTDTASQPVTADSVTYHSNLNVIEFATTAPLSPGVHRLTLKAGVHGIKNSKGAALLNTSPVEFKDEITIDFMNTNGMVAPVDTAAPVLSGIPPSLLTNRGFLIKAQVNENTGYLSTDGANWKGFTTAGTNVFIERTTTLYSFARDAAGNTSATNISVYTVSRRSLSEVQVANNPYRGSGEGFVFAQLPYGTSIQVFTISGKNVQTLSGASMDVSGKVVWNLKNQNGSRVEPGVYLALLSATAENTASASAENKIVKLMVLP